MDLTPKLPPGRANRKALAFAAEIHRLRVAGYSFEAIRLALQDAGVHVSRTTVKREAARRAAAAPAALDPCAAGVRPLPPPPPSLPSVLPVALGPSAASTSFLSDSRSGKQIAEAFMKGRINNPLVRERMEDEARRN